MEKALCYKLVDLVGEGGFNFYGLFDVDTYYVYFDIETPIDLVMIHKLIKLLEIEEKTVYINTHSENTLQVCSKVKGEK